MGCPKPRVELLKQTVKKTVNLEAKALLQPLLDTWRIDTKCLQGQKLAKKVDSGKNKSIYSTPFLPIYLIGNSHLSSTKFLPPTKKRTKTIKKVFNVDKDKNKTKTPLQQVLTLLPRKKKKTSPTSTIGERAITQINVLKKRNRSQ